MTKITLKLGSLLAPLLAGFVLVALRISEEGVAIAQESEQSEARAEQVEVEAVPEKQLIAGLRGLTILSKVTFVAAPDAPHSLEANYIFPARTRWWLSFDDQVAGYRRAEYRYGERVFLLNAGATDSEELDGSDRTSSLRRMELRRALFLYPAGFEWEEYEGRARASLGELESGLAVGSLEVVLDEDERPSEMRVLTPEGEEQETLAVEGWMNSAERDWPERLRLRVGDQDVWTEVIAKVDPGRRYLDSFFIPVDRRAGAANELGAETNSEIRQIDLPLFAFRNFELPAGTTWEQALVAGREIRERENRTGSPVADRLDEDVRFEIDAKGRPTFAVLHLRETSPLPEGWTLTEARSGLMIVLDRFEQLSSARIDALLRAIPVGSQPTPAYARTVGTLDEYRVQVLLPLVPID